MKNAIGHELCPELMQSLGLELHDAPQQKDTATLQQRLQSNGKLMNSLEDAIRADETFTILMGDKVQPRREFIEQNAQYVTNLDV